MCIDECVIKTNMFVRNVNYYKYYYLVLNNYEAYFHFKEYKLVFSNNNYFDFCIKAIIMEIINFSTIFNIQYLNFKLYYS